MAEVKINERILAAIAAPGGAFMDDLRGIVQDVDQELQALKDAGFEWLINVGPGGHDYCWLIAAPGPVPEPAAEPDPDPQPQPAAPSREPEMLTVAEETPTRIVYPGVAEQIPDGMPKAPPAAPPAPSEAPRAPKTPVECSSVQGEYDAHYTMNRPDGAPIEVYLKVVVPTEVPQPAETEPLLVVDTEPQPKKEDETVPLFDYECRDCTKHFEELEMHGLEKPKCPKCGSTNLLKLPSRISSASKAAGTEKDPNKKSLQQISKEIDQQVQSGEISPSLADAQGKLASL